MGGGELEWTDRRVMDTQVLGSMDGHFLAHLQAPPTFKVHSAIPIEVHISDNFLYVSMSHLMTEEFPHGLSQLTGANLPVTVGVELERAGRRGSYNMDMVRSKSPG